MKKLYWQLATRLKVLKNWQIPAWIAYGKIPFKRLFSGRQHAESVTRNLLLLAWEFPPQVTGGVYRPASWAKYAADTNWSLRVLCRERPLSQSSAGAYLERSIPQEVRIHRIADQTRGPHPWPLPEIDGGSRNALTVYENAQTLMQREQPGILLASGPPFHNFVAATWLAEQFGWPLVLDYRDEWTNSPFNFVIKDEANIKLEKRCLRKADLIIFTTESQRKHAIETFSELNPMKSVVIPNGWEPCDFATLQTAPSPLSSSKSIEEKETLTIAYLGNFGSWTSPQPFLTALTKTLDTYPQLKNRIKLQCIGHKSPEALNQLADFKYQNILELIDQIPKQEACRVMQTVDLLLILNPSIMHRYIPGKLYEYIASGTPVIVFGKGGEIDDIISSLDAGVIINRDDEKELSHFLNNFKPRAHSQKSIRIDQWLQSRQRNRLANSLFEQLDNLIQSPQKKSITH